MTEKMATSIEWPNFACRRDCWLNLTGEQSGTILRCFNNGFDADFSGTLVYFATSIDSLHPLSLLIPSSLPDLVSEGQVVEQRGRSLRIMNYQLQQTANVAVVDRVPQFDVDLVTANLVVLHSALKLFGRSSIVLPLVLGCHTVENALSGVESMLLEPKLDLDRLSAFVGVGEGLTPAFDDFLAGMIFADRFFAFRQIEIPAGFMLHISTQTTRQAVQQLEFASRGALSLRFEKFADILGRRSVRIHEMVPLLNCGHSSGTDILCGLWYYLMQRVRILKNYSSGE